MNKIDAELVRRVKMKAHNAARYLANTERYKAYSTAWKVANPERAKAYVVAWRAANPERDRESKAAWKAANPERAKACDAAWQKANPGRCNAKAARRRAAKLQATPLWSDKEAISCIYQEAHYQQMHVDHVVPLQSKLVCGLHWEGNLQLLSKSENSRKHNSHWPDMP